MFNPWESHGTKIYKINLIKTMINRLKIICSNESRLNKDLKQLKESFLWSGYPQARSVGKGGPVRKIVRGGPKLYYRVLCYVIIGGP